MIKGAFPFSNIRQQYTEDNKMNVSRPKGEKDIPEWDIQISCRRLTLEERIKKNQKLEEARKK